MNTHDYQIAQKLKQELANVVKLVDFRVFGSRASGKADEYSDMDVFLDVESLDKALENKIYDIVWAVCFEHFMVISALIFTRYEIEKSPLRASPIVKNIMEYGVSI